MRQHGWVGRPLLGYDDGNGVHMLTGSHRLWAAKAAGLDQVPCYVIDAKHDAGEDYEGHEASCWMCRLIVASDDDERLSALEMDGGDADALSLMRAELAARESDN